MFRPFNFLVLLIGAYLFLPVFGFGLFPEHFDFSANQTNVLILGSYISILLIAARAGATFEARGKKSSPAPGSPSLNQPWASRGEEHRAFVFLLMTTTAVVLLCVFSIAAAGMLDGDFSPHTFRLGVATSGNLALIVTYNAFSLATLIATNLALLALVKSRRKRPFVALLAILLILVLITGQRSMIMLVLLSYLFLKSDDPKRFSAFRVGAVLLLGLAFTIVLGVIRQGDDFDVIALVWQLSVRFDLFYPQFFNFLDTYRTLPDIGYGYFHFTFPLQVIPSSVLPNKPLTFLHFINRDLMGIAEGTGNDFSAFAEFIYDFGVIAGAFFYAFHCFIATFFMQRIYRGARTKPVYFALYFPCLLVYISLVLLTGVSNQAHLFASAGIVAAIWLCRSFIGYVERRPARSSQAGSMEPTQTGRIDD